MKIMKLLHELRAAFIVWAKGPRQVALEDELSRLRDDRDRWIRLFNRLEGAITHHKRDEGFPDTHDERLYAARDRILKDACEGRG